MKNPPLFSKCINSGGDDNWMNIIPIVKLLLPAVDHVDCIADEHGQNNDKKAECGIVAHGVLLLSER